MTESEAKKIIKLLQRMSNQLSKISKDVAYLVSREKARDQRQDERSRNCSNSHASAFRPVNAVGSRGNLLGGLTSVEHQLRLMPVCVWTSGPPRPHCCKDRGEREK